MPSFTHEEIHSYLCDLEKIVEPTLYQAFESITSSYKELQRLLLEKNQSIKKLRELVFGGKTEKIEESEKNTTADSESIQSLSLTAEGEQETESKGEIGDGKVSEDKANVKKPKPKKKRETGKLGVDDYPGAKTIHICHPDLKAGDQCPICQKSKIYQREPLTFVKITGTPPLEATINEYESLRCGLCGEIFNAPRPEDHQQKYDDQTVAMIAILKYGMGMPFYRMDRLQEALGVPMPASTQWKIIEESLPLFKVVYEALKESAGSAELIYIDDTTAKILSEMGKRREVEESMSEERKGLFTTAMIARTESQKIVSLYFTGHDHAGENLSNILSKRPKELPKPMLMCDALSRNTPKDISVILGRCLAHARRKFFEIKDDHPDECEPIIELIAHIYAIDKWIKKEGMSATDRLMYHQMFSTTAVNTLHELLKKLSVNGDIEPATNLGKGINYSLKHWEGLTLFLRVVGACPCSKRA
jgi:transposase